MGLTGKDRLIVALDVPSQDEALALIRELKDITFFKINLQLLLAGKVIPLIQEVQKQRGAGKVFLDIKWGGDIPNTTTEFVRACIESSIVKFITLIEANTAEFTAETIKTGKAVRQELHSDYPLFLMVSLLSSLDASDLKETLGTDNLNAYIVARVTAMLKMGCDGLIVSGEAIKLCYDTFVKQQGKRIDIVSPGIRPAGASHDDHKRYTTPSQAIAWGADYLVVGRPIINAPRKNEAAKRIIDEIDEALAKKSSSPPVPAAVTVPCH